MLPPRPFAIAVATCAAASLASRSGGTGEPASVQAAADLARHAALDARSALGMRSRRRARRLLKRADRRLGYSYALTARLLTDHAPAGATTSAIFIRAAAEIAQDSASLATGRERRQQALAFRTLRRTSRLQEDVALELSTRRSAGSLEDLIAALSIALRAQDALLSTLEAAARLDRISAHRRRTLHATSARADAARVALCAAWEGTLRAVQKPLYEVHSRDCAGNEVDDVRGAPRKPSGSDAKSEPRSDWR